MKTLAAALVLCAVLVGKALAHPGHGMDSPWHWHATDTFGLLVLAVLVLAALLCSRK